jgi:hypothetical protein
MTGARAGVHPLFEVGPLRRSAGSRWRGRCNTKPSVVKEAGVSISSRLPPKARGENVEVISFGKAAA